MLCPEDDRPCYLPECHAHGCMAEAPGEEIDDDEEDREAECGRWDNGRLTPSCLLAGTEWCDWECPLSR